MAQCQGMTRKGERCRREAAEGSAYCSIHIDQAVRPPEPQVEQPWDRDAVVKTAVGLALVGAILFFRLRR